MGPFILFNTRVSQQSNQAGDSAPTLFFSIFSIFPFPLSLPFFFFYTRLRQQTSQAGGSGPNFHISKFSNFFSLFISPFLLLKHQASPANSPSRWLRPKLSYFQNFRSAQSFFQFSTRRSSRNQFGKQKENKKNKKNK